MTSPLDIVPEELAPQFSRTRVMTSPYQNNEDTTSDLVSSVPESDYNSREILEAFDRTDYDSALAKAMPHALSGNPDAQCTVALMYEFGFGVQRDVLEAERWLLRASDQDSALAWNHLGFLYASKRDELKHRWVYAHRCWERARELGFFRSHPNPATRFW